MDTLVSRTVMSIRSHDAPRADLDSHADTCADRIITGTGFVTRTCMIHPLVDSSSFSNVRTNDYRNVSCDSLEENPLEVGLQFQLRIRPSPMVSSRRFLFTLN